jgi:hypothetical protein
MNAARHSLHDDLGGSPAAILFQPDPLALADYLETLRRNAFQDPERALLFAVLEDAVLNFQKYLFSERETETHLFKEAEEWISREDRAWPFSFINVCDSLGIHPHYLRKGLLQWKRQVSAEKLHEKSSKRKR